MPEEIEGWAILGRDDYFSWGVEPANKFLNECNLDLIIRSHTVERVYICSQS